MAEAFLSTVVERLFALMEEQALYHINLVRGAEEEAHNLAVELNTIRNVLDDAEKREFKDKGIRNWLKKIEHMSYEMDDILDEWHYAILKHKMEYDQSDAMQKIWSFIQKVCSFIPSSCLSCFKTVSVRHEIAKKILNVKAQLDVILREKDRYGFLISQPTSKFWRIPSTSFVDLTEVYGRDSDRDFLVTKLTTQEKLGIHVVSIVGVGGLGKTALAKLVYHDSRVEKSFDLKIWVCVSDPFDLGALAKGIIEGAKKNPPCTNNLETLLQCVRACILGKKFLLVLDDVWTEEYEKCEDLKNCLKCGGAGSKILVTTRNQNVAKIIGTMDNDIHHLGELSVDDCWSLLHRIALCGRNSEKFENFNIIGKDIAKKCKGLPLAARVLGSLLRKKNTLEGWENVLNSEIWKLGEAEAELFPHLRLSYDELSPVVKRCFSYCAVLPKDFKICVERLIENWMALGYLGSDGDMEVRGREYFNILVMHSLFQDFEKNDLDQEIISCKIHDIVHDFAQFLRKSDGEETKEINKTSCGACDPSLVSTVNKFRIFYWNDKHRQNICHCLTRLRIFSMENLWLESILSIEQGLEKLIHLRWLDLSGNTLFCEVLKIIFLHYNLQTLFLSNCNLEEIPKEIGNLIHLRHLVLSNNDLEKIPSEIGNLIHLRHFNLSSNKSLKELPESICNLHELIILNINFCPSLTRLPEGIHKLKNLRHLRNMSSFLEQLPQGLAQLTGLRILNEFRIGKNGQSTLGLLKNLNLLSGSLELNIQLTDNNSKGLAVDAREAELSKKIHIQELRLLLFDMMEEGSSSSVSMDIIDALEPPPNLQELVIEPYHGSKIPAWLESPSLNNLREIRLCNCVHLPSLPPLGKLPCLERIEMRQLNGVQFVGREFLGITSTVGGQRNMDIQSSSNTIIAFPKLQTLEFYSFSLWKEWEDITAEEEDSAAVLLMPCLAHLIIGNCSSLTALPHRLLRKASSLEVLEFSFSPQLAGRYRNKDNSAWKSISRNNPRLRLEIRNLRRTSSSLQLLS